MKSILIIRRLMIALVAVLFVGAGLLASSPQALAQPSWVPKPPKAIGGKCDADPQWMRKWHMTILDHKRDETMRDGIRTDKYSLKRCISCHAVKGEAGKYLTVKDERHFCRACHDYAAVRIDCFDCHASRPGDEMDKAAKTKGNPHKSASDATSSMGHKSDTALAALQNFALGQKNKIGQQVTAGEGK